MHTLMVYVGMPVFSSKPHCLDCDPEYFKNVSGFQPDRRKHDSWVGIEPVSNLLFTNITCMYIWLYIMLTCIVTWHNSNTKSL